MSLWLRIIGFGLFFPFCVAPRDREIQAAIIFLAGAILVIGAEIADRINKEPDDTPDA